MLRFCTHPSLNEEAKEIEPRQILTNRSWFSLNPWNEYLSNRHPVIPEQEQDNGQQVPALPKKEHHPGKFISSDGWISMTPNLLPIDANSLVNTFNANSGRKHPVDMGLVGWNWGWRYHIIMSDDRLNFCNRSCRGKKAWQNTGSRKKMARINPIPN